MAKLSPSAVAGGSQEDNCVTRAAFHSFGKLEQGGEENPALQFKFHIFTVSYSGFPVFSYSDSSILSSLTNNALAEFFGSVW